MVVIDDRAGPRLTIVTSQLPIGKWHAWIGGATIADAILDRRLLRSHCLNIKGESMPQRKVAFAHTENSDCAEIRTRRFRSSALRGLTGAWA